MIVIDTAPTGHALRLLEMPDAAREWVQVLLRVLLKYRSLVRPGQLAAELVELSKSIRGLQELLRDPRDTRFIVVTRAAAVPRLETERLLRRLRPLAAGDARGDRQRDDARARPLPRCRAIAAAERRELAALRALQRAAAFASALSSRPRSSAPPPRGVAALDRWAAGL